MDTRTLDKRCVKRTKMVLGLRLPQQQSQDSGLLVHTLDISSSGAKVGALRSRIQPGSILILQRRLAYPSRPRTPKATTTEVAPVFALFEGRGFRLLPRWALLILPRDTTEPDEVQITRAADATQSRHRQNPARDPSPVCERSISLSAAESPRPSKSAKTGAASVRMASGKGWASQPERGECRDFYREDWGEGANRPLAPDPTPRFTIFFARELSLVSLSHVRGALHGTVPITC